MCKRSDHTKPVNMSMAWLEQFGADFGDKMPDSEKVNLPSSMTRNDVYDRMTVELRDMGDDFCSKSVFFKLWRKDYKNIVIPKVRF